MIPGIIAILSSAVVALWVWLRARTIQVEQLKWERELAKLDTELTNAAADARKKDGLYDEFVKEFDRRNPGVLHDIGADPARKPE